MLTSDERLSAVERLDIYANMYFARLLDVLRTDYPVVARMLGEVHFHNLATDYLLAHPPSHFSLRYAGEPLARFLEDHPLTAERPWLPDLARFEWALVDAFDAPDSDTASVEDLAGVAPEDWPGLRFGAVPSARVLDLRFAVLPTWTSGHDESPPDDQELPERPEALPQAIRVWRRNHEVLHRPVDEPERVALRALADERPFGEICDAVGALVDEELAAPRAANMLATWLADGFIASVARPERNS